MKSTVDELAENAPNSKSQSWKGDKIKIKYHTPNSYPSTGSPSPLVPSAGSAVFLVPAKWFHFSLRLYLLPPPDYLSNKRHSPRQPGRCWAGSSPEDLWRSRRQVTNLFKSEHRMAVMGITPFLLICIWKSLNGTGPWRWNRLLQKQSFLQRVWW